MRWRSDAWRLLAARDWWAGALVLAGGIVLAVLLQRTLDAQHRAERSRDLQAAAERLAGALQADLARAEQLTRAAAAYLQTAPRFDREGFDRYAAAALAGQQTVRALHWEPRVLRGERAAFENHWREHGIEGFALREPAADGALQPAAERVVSYPVLSGAALDGALPIGLVAATEISVESATPLQDEPASLVAATRAQALARDRNAPMLTAAFVAPGRGPDAPLTMAVRMPVYADEPIADVESRRAALRGHVAGMIELPALTAPLRASAAELNMPFRLVDVGDAPPRLLHAEDTARAGRDGDAVAAMHAQVLPALGRELELQLVAPPEPFDRGLLPRAVLVIGSAMAVTLALAVVQMRHGQRALEGAQRRLRRLSDALPVGMFQVGEDAHEIARVHYVNRSAARLVGVDEDVLINAPHRLFERIEPDERLALLRAMADAIRARRPIERELLVAGDGGTRRIRLSALPSSTSASGATVLVGVIEDVTALRAAGDQLERFAAEQSAMLESVPFGLLFADRGRITRANPAMANLLGYSDPDELVGLPLRSLHVDDADHRALRRAASVRLQAGRVFEHEWQLVRRDGEAFDAQLIGRRMTDDDAEQELWIVLDRGHGVAASRDALRRVGLER